MKAVREFNWIKLNLFPEKEEDLRCRACSPAALRINAN